MPRGEHQEPASGPPDDTTGDVDTDATSLIPSSSSRSVPREKCDKACCRSGDDWLRYQRGLADYPNGPAFDHLLGHGRGGAWPVLTASISIVAEALERFGLARWRDLSPSVREKMKSWSPEAKKLWESDFYKHQEALVQVWIWCYVEETLFFFINSNASADGAVACCSPVWEHVRTLARDLQPVLSLKDDQYLENICRIQFNGWRRITEHLVRKGLGLKAFATPAVLMAHCKKSLRSLFVDGETQLPDLAHDADWRARGDGDDAIDKISYYLKGALESALQVQHCIHGLEGTLTLRFTPIDSDSDQPWGFPFDDGQMRLSNPPEVKSWKEEDDGPPPVQLVCVPMLAFSGRYDMDFGKVLIQMAPMSVVTPWVFTVDEAGEHMWPIWKEVAEKRRAKRRRVEADARREAGEPFEEQVEEGWELRRSKRVKRNWEGEVEELQLEQAKAAQKLLDEQKAAAAALLAKQQAEAKALLAEQQARAKALLAKQRAATKAGRRTYRYR